MSSKTGVESKIQNLEALLGLYPFDKEPENSRELENVDFNQIYSLLPNVVRPDPAEKKHVYTITSESDLKNIETLTQSLNLTVKNLKQQFEVSPICPDYQERGFDINDVYIKSQQNVPGYLYYSPEKGNLNDFIDKVPSNYTVVVPPGTYFTSIKFRRQINLIGIDAQSKVQITAPKGMNAIICTAPGGMIQGFTFQTSEASIYPTAEIVDGNVKFFNCTFIGSKGAATKVSNIARANFFNCVIRESEEFALNITDSAIVKCYGTEISNGFKSNVGLFTNSASFFKKCKIFAAPEGVIIKDSASAIFSETEISSNSRNGVNISSNSPFIKLDQCEISDNSKMTNGQSPGAAIYINTNVTITIQDCKFRSNKCCILATENAGVLSKSNTYSDAQDSSIVYLRKEAKMVSESDTFSGQCRNCVHAAAFSTFEATQTTFFSLITRDCQAVSCLESSNLKLNQCTFEQIANCCIVIADKVNATVLETTFNIVPSAIYFKGDVTATVQGCKFQNIDESITFNNASGQINLFDSDFIDNNKTCIKFTGDTKPHIKNCNFVGKEHHEKSSDQKNSGPTALNIQELASEPFIENCKFNGFGTGARFKSGSHPTFKSCDFFNCNISIGISNASPNFDTCKFFIMEDGIRIYETCNSVFTNCTIEAARQNGIYIDGNRAKGSSPHFTRCNIFSAKFGVMAKNNASPIFDGCSFSNNRDLSASITYNAAAVFNECEFQNSIVGIAIAIDEDASAQIKRCKIHDEQSAGVFIKNGNCNLEESEIYKCKSGVRIEMHADTKYTPQVIRNNIHDILNEAILLVSGKCIIKNNMISDNTTGICAVAAFYEMNKDNITDNNFSNTKGQDLKIYIPKKEQDEAKKKEAVANSPSASNLQAQGASSGQNPNQGLQSLPGVAFGNPSALKSLPPGAGQPSTMRTIGGQNTFGQFPAPGGVAPNATAVAAQAPAPGQPGGIQSQYPGYVSQTMRPGQFQTQMGAGPGMYQRTPTSPGGMSTGQPAFSSMHTQMPGQQPAYATSFKPGATAAMPAPTYTTNATMMPGNQFSKFQQYQQAQNVNYQNNGQFSSATPYTQRPGQQPFAAQSNQYANYAQQRQGQIYQQANQQQYNQQYQYQQNAQYQQTQYQQQQLAQQQQYQQQQLAQQQQQMAQTQLPNQYQYQQLAQARAQAQAQQQYMQNSAYSSAQQKRAENMGPR